MHNKLHKMISEALKILYMTLVSEIFFGVWKNKKIKAAQEKNQKEEISFTNKKIMLPCHTIQA